MTVVNPEKDQGPLSVAPSQIMKENSPVHEKAAGYLNLPLA